MGRLGDLRYEQRADVHHRTSYRTIGPDSGKLVLHAGQCQEFTLVAQDCVSVAAGSFKSPSDENRAEWATWKILIPR